MSISIAVGVDGLLCFIALFSMVSIYSNIKFLMFRRLTTEE